MIPDLGLGPDLGVAALMGVLAVYLVAGTVKGVLGFALPLVSVALLPFLVPVEQALALNGVVLFFTNLVQVRQAGHTAEAARVAWPVVAGMLVTVPLGAQIAASTPRGTLLIVLGGFILVFAALTLLKPSLRLAAGLRVRVGLGTGLLSGVVGALTSAPGPIFVTYVVSLALARPVYMATLGLIMASFGLMLGLSFWAIGLIGSGELALGLLCVVPASAGFLVGDRIGTRLPAERFRQIVLAMLGVLACLMIRRGLLLSGPS